MRRVTCICKANSMLLFCILTARIKAMCFFFFLLHISLSFPTEVNIFPWYFVSKLLILRDLFILFYFFPQEPEQPKHMQIHRLCSIVRFAYNRCSPHVCFFLPLFAAAMAPVSPVTRCSTLLAARAKHSDERGSSCLKIHKANRQIAAAAAAAASRVHKTQLTRASPL